MKPRVFLTRAMPAPVMKRLISLFDLTVNPHDRPLSASELIRGVRGQDAMIPMLSDRVTARIIASGDRLRVIANYAAGYNNIDLPAAASRGIVVTNTPG
ncbi:MAG TPA: D-glycerate dehydrogenase, partial [Nitrospiria bacterium]